MHLANWLIFTFVKQFAKGAVNESVHNAISSGAVFLDNIFTFSDFNDYFSDMNSSEIGANVTSEWTLCFFSALAQIEIIST